MSLVKQIYGEPPIPLHRRVYKGSGRQYLVDCIDSSFVSSIGARVTKFEEKVAAFAGAAYGVATMNGTAARHATLLIAGVNQGDGVLSQTLTLIPTAARISSP